ncbi:MAG TPA: hypothetical protein VK833_10765 [Gillisia sp.]|nr:hypothetical protein [Gillisia sp.]
MRKKIILSGLVIVLISLLSTSCSKDDPINPPIVTNQANSSNTNARYNSVEINGTVDVNGGEEITSQGVVWSTSPNPDMNSNVIQETSTTFLSEIGDLEPNTAYYFKIFASTSSKTYYSDEVSVSTTALNSPTATNESTAENANPTFTSVDISGTVDINEGEEISAYGVVWSTSENPDITDGMIAETSNTFMTEITGLEMNTAYFFRIFATTASGTYYSEEVSFATLDFKDSKWDITFPRNNNQTWNADVNFYADGTTLYDEPAAPGVYLLEGTYVLDGTDLTYNMTDGYILVGTISGKTMSGTYAEGKWTWTAVLIEE